MMAETSQKSRGWYLSLMSPNTKGPDYAWLDPSSLYINAEAFADCVNDLAKPFEEDKVDLVCGIDAMGFVLGAAVARQLGKGFLSVRKSGHLCVDTTSTEYTDYQERTKILELRTNPFPPKTRVLLVDQWIQTGGTMIAASELIKNAGGQIAGMAVIACENSEKGKTLRRMYKVVDCVPPELQNKIDDHSFV